MSSGNSLIMMPADQMFRDRDIKNLTLHVTQDTILKTAQLSKLPEASYSAHLSKSTALT